MFLQCYVLLQRSALYCYVVLVLLTMVKVLLLLFTIIMILIIMMRCDMDLHQTHGLLQHEEQQQRDATQVTVPLRLQLVFAIPTKMVLSLF
jgi:hypothetical protein